MAEHDEGSKDLIGRARQGDPAAQQLLLSQHRDRLRQMVRFRLDPRLAARLDDSDVVQEVLAEAARKLPEYLRHMPMPMYPWLRRIAGERLTKLHRDHLAARKRSAARELPIGSALPDQSAMVFAALAISSRSSPSAQAIRAEQRDRVRQCLAQLSEPDREVLVMRYVEQLSIKEIAAVLDATEGAIKTRHFRALARMRQLLGPLLGDQP